MIDKAFNRLGVGLGLFLMVMELTYINTKSLSYLVEGAGSIDRLFAIVGAFAFSIVTIVIMRKPGRTFLKFAFPLFDTGLVFCGFNLKYADNLLSNPIAFGLTIFMAVFTGLITYSLGKINYEEHTTNQVDVDKLKESLQQSEAIIKIKETHLQELTAEYKILNTDLQKVGIELQQSKTELQQTNLRLQQSDAIKKQAEARLQQVENDLEKSGATVQQYKERLQQFEKLQQKITAACTCEFCQKEFPSEAAKRSHIGKCPEKK
jgi:hypothetical protein